MAGQQWWPFHGSQHQSDPWHQNNESSSDPSEAQKLVFYCQLAHGSPTAVIQNFSTVQQLYKRLADAFGIPVESILFCTLNTHKLDMDKLLGSTICPEDFIFCHVAGQPKELELLKADSAIGLTITDNGNGIAFVKDIQPGSIAARHGAIAVGDHIQKINGESAVGFRHFDVAWRLREVDVGGVVTLRLISPLSSGFSMIGPANRGGKSGAVGNKVGSTGGRKTLRFRADGKAVLEDDIGLDEQEKCAIARVDSLLDSYLGVSDTELAQRFWSLAQEASNPADLGNLIDNSDTGLKALSFGSTTFVYDLWGIVTDFKRSGAKPIRG